jgi:hypothetical protein
MQEFADNYAIAEQILMRHRIHNKRQKFRFLRRKTAKFNSDSVAFVSGFRFERDARKCFAGRAKAIKLSKSLEGFEDGAAFRAEACRESS